VSTCFSVWLVTQRISIVGLTVRSVRNAMREAWPLFLFRTSLSLYTTANVFVLGLFASPSSVAFYAGAEKIARTPLGLLTPFTQAIYPRLSRNGRPADTSNEIRKWSFLVMSGAGLIVGGIMVSCAPWLIRLVLGPGYEPAAAALRILSILPPVVAVNTYFGMHCLLPMGYDRQFVRTTILAGALCVSLGVLLVPLFSHLGMCIAAVSAEVFVLVSFALTLQRAGHSAIGLQVVKPTEA
jgi:PST family polysaccharide transporter